MDEMKRSILQARLDSVLECIKDLEAEISIKKQDQKKLGYANGFLEGQINDLQVRLSNMKSAAKDLGNFYKSMIEMEI